MRTSSLHQKISFPHRSFCEARNAVLILPHKLKIACNSTPEWLWETLWPNQSDGSDTNEKSLGTPPALSGTSWHRNFQERWKLFAWKRYLSQRRDYCALLGQSLETATHFVAAPIICPQREVLWRKEILLKYSMVTRCPECRSFSAVVLFPANLWTWKNAKVPL